MFDIGFNHGRIVHLFQQLSQKRLRFRAISKPGQHNYFVFYHRNEMLMHANIVATDSVNDSLTP